MKLDPSKPDDPLVWSVDDHEIRDQSGIWGTPAIDDGVVYADTNRGRLIGVDQKTGAVLLGEEAARPDVAVAGRRRRRADPGRLQRRAARLRRVRPAVEPTELWTVELGGCIESTPAVWKGRIYVGTRAGGSSPSATRRPTAGARHFGGCGRHH